MLESIMNYILDILHDFFDVISLPNPKHTLHAFIVSLVFIPLSIVLQFAGYFTFVSWQEACTCSLMMGILAMSSYINKGMIDNFTNEFLHKNEIEEEQEEYDEDYDDSEYQYEEDDEDYEIQSDDEYEEQEYEDEEFKDSGG